MMFFGAAVLNDLADWELTRRRELADGSAITLDFGCC